MKKSCNYCRAYDASGNCKLGYPQKLLSDDELHSLNIWPYGLVEVRYYIKTKPAVGCPAPKTYNDLFRLINETNKAGVLLCNHYKMLCGKIAA